MQRAAIERLLPAVIQQTATDDSPLATILEVMEALHGPTEEALDHLERFFSPYRAPDEFLPFLTRWVDLDWMLGDAAAASPVVATTEFPGGPQGLRELINTGAHLAKWRGTERGLLLLLQLATGREGFTVGTVARPDGTLRPFCIGVRAPDGPDKYRELVERIVRHEKPAHLEAEITFEDPP